MKRPRATTTRTTGLLLLALMATVCPDAQAVPSFSRQTGLKCNVCHSNPPELTAFGRKFKLEGYTLTAKAAMTIDDQDLTISRSVPIAVMLLVSHTSANTAVPGAQSGNAGFPQALSLFLASDGPGHLLAPA
jgi:hypothetical protein